MKICVVSSCGGHLAEVRALQAAYSSNPHFYVLNARVKLPRELEGKTEFISHAQRDWRVLLNFVEAWRILRRERPTLLLTTGAGPAVPFAVLCKLFGIPVVFVEISAQVTVPSLSGRIMYFLADRFFYQWRALRRYFPRATYGGLLL